jgi:hypothetical protein
MQKLSVLTNIISPYRRPLFGKICREFDSYILLSGEEDNRSKWNTLDDTGSNAKVINLDGFTLNRKIFSDSRIYSHSFIHINPKIPFRLYEVNPDVVISFEMGTRTILSLIYCFLFETPLWVWWGGTKHTERDIGLIRKLVRWILSRVVPNWISYGKTSTEYLHSLGVQPDSILQIQNCVDERKFLNVW